VPDSELVKCSGGRFPHPPAAATHHAYDAAGASGRQRPLGCIARVSEGCGQCMQATAVAKLNRRCVGRTCRCPESSLGMRLG
jgi:hypothetical protein